MYQKHALSLARPRQVVQWTMAAASGHPVLACTVERIFRTAEQPGLGQNIAWTYADILDLTGPGVFTDCVLGHLRSHGKAWEDVRGGSLVGDVLILGVNGFASNQPHSGSVQRPSWRAFKQSEITAHGIMVEHLFAGSWKNADFALDYGVQRHAVAERQIGNWLVLTSMPWLQYPPNEPLPQSSVKTAEFISLALACCAVCLWSLKRRQSVYKIEPRNGQVLWLRPTKLLLLRFGPRIRMIGCWVVLLVLWTLLTSTSFGGRRTEHVQGRYEMLRVDSSSDDLKLPFKGVLVRTVCTTLLAVKTTGYLEVVARNTGSHPWTPKDEVTLAVWEGVVSFMPTSQRLSGDVWTLPQADTSLRMPIKYDSRCPEGPERFRVGLQRGGKWISGASDWMQVTCIESMSGLSSAFVSVGPAAAEVHRALIPFSFNISFENTGADEWRRGSVKLSPLESRFKGVLDESQADMVEQRVAPGEMATFYVTTRFIHGNCPSIASVQLQLKHKDEFFGDPSAPIRLRCSSKREYASFVAASSFPSYLDLNARQSISVWVSFHNTGQVSWKRGEHYLVSTLTGQAVGLPVEEVKAGRYVKFQFDLIAMTDLSRCDGKQMSMRFQMSSRFYRFGRKSPEVQFVCGKLSCVTFPSALSGREFMDQYGGSRNSTSQDGLYPRIIHQSWKTTTCTALQRKCIKSWHRVHPDWLYVFWSDNELEELIQTAWPHASEKYHDLPRDIFRADFARYVLLYEFGGVYADIDVEAVQPFDALMEEHKAFLGLEPRAHSLFLNGQAETLCNAVMGSWPKQPFWRAFTDWIVGNDLAATTLDPNDLTGPRGLQRFLQEGATPDIAKAIVVLDPVYFYPGVALYQADRFRKICENRFILDDEARKTCEELDATGYVGAPMDSRTYAFHHWTCSWC